MNKVAKFAAPAAVALVLGTAVPAMADDAAAPPKGQVSAAAGPALQAAQKDIGDKKYDDALKELEKVKSNPKKNDYDDFAMNQFYYQIYVAQKDLTDAEPALEAWLSSKYLKPEDEKRLVIAATYLNYQNKNYDKTIEYGTRAIKEGPVPDQLQTVVAQAYYLKNDFKDTDKFVQNMVDDEVKAGMPPTEDTLMLGYSAAQKLDDKTGRTHWLELLVSYHPKLEYWQNLLDGFYQSKLTDRQLLQVYRLSAEVGALSKGQEYAEMAQLALDSGSPGEAVAILNKGFAANVFTDKAEQNRNTHLLELAKKQAASDQPTLAKSEADGTKAATGDQLLGAGIGYFGYGEYDKASKDISAGLAKGVAKDTTEARLLLGIAQLKAGDKEASVKTFNSIKGDPVSERLAQLWVLRAKTA